jgi:hypothetical protein
MCVAIGHGVARDEQCVFFLNAAEALRIETTLFRHERLVAYEYVSEGGGIKAAIEL